MMPTVLDLFCGCGGMSWGLHKSGFEILAGIDFWDIALKTYQLNHPRTKVYNGDVSKLNPEEIMAELNLKKGDLDVIIGGPPCQGFSKNVPASGRFLEDERNQLFRSYLDFVKVFYPKVVIMENVAEIYNAYDGVVRDEIVDTLQKLGYEVEISVVTASDYGVPQKRRRCFFFASRTAIPPVFPNQKLFEINKISAWAAISDLPIVYNGEGEEHFAYSIESENNYQCHMRKGSDGIYDHIAKNLKPKQMARVTSLKAGQAWKDLPKELQPKGGYSGAYGRLDFDMVAPTITRWVFHPGSGRFCHPREPRVLTIREVARIQSFSDDFRLLGSYVDKAGQLGNAVPPLIMETLAGSIKKCLALPSNCSEELEPRRPQLVVSE